MFCVYGKVLWYCQASRMAMFKGTRNMLLNLDLDSRFFRPAYFKTPLHSSCFQYGSGFWPTVGVALQMILLPCWLWYHDWKKSSDCEAQTSRLSNSSVMWKDFVALSFHAVQQNLLLFCLCCLGRLSGVNLDHCKCYPFGALCPVSSQGLRMDKL
jgi:hypothetical protein